MADIAYTVSPGRIKQLLEKITEVAVPKSVSLAWLTSVGFTSSNDRRLIGVLKQVLFIDEAGKPTALWEQYRAGDGGGLARGIRQGYDILYQTYEDAHMRNAVDLEHVLKAKYAGLGKDTIGRAVSTFKALVAQADFADDSIEGEFRVEGEATVPRGNGHIRPKRREDPAPVSKVSTSINYNFHFTLPESSDAGFYERVFMALRGLVDEGSRLQLLEGAEKGESHEMVLRLPAE